MRPLLTHMESVAAAWTRLLFQSFGTTAGLHNRETIAWLVYAFYQSNRLDCKTKNEISKKKVRRCGCTTSSAKISRISQDLLFCLLKKKVFAIGLHALAHILGTASNCCCTADSFTCL